VLILLFFFLLARLSLSRAPVLPRATQGFSGDQRQGFASGVVLILPRHAAASQPVRRHGMPSIGARHSAGSGEASCNFSILHANGLDRALRGVGITPP
jgi:hypothetical protein